MSAWIVTEEHVRYLVEASLRNRRMGEMSWSWVDPAGNRQRNRISYENVDAVGQMLWDANHESIRARYSDQKDQAPTYRHKRCATEYDPIAVLKSVHCYEYQSCEHDGWAASEAKAFCASLESRQISALPGYDDAPWGIPRGTLSDEERDRRDAKDFLAALRALEEQRGKLSTSALVLVDALIEEASAPRTISAPVQAVAPLRAKVKAGTFRRDKLKRLCAAGKLELVDSYSYDETSGMARSKEVRQCTMTPPDSVDAHGNKVWGSRNPSIAYFDAFDFESSSGGAHQNEDGTIVLRVHSNCNYTFRIK